MGPNGYISPGKSCFKRQKITRWMLYCQPLTSLECNNQGGGKTPLHDDGHGTVDSAHTNLHGYNEVVILRRLPEEHRAYANGVCSTLLRTLPHDRDDNVDWPSNSMIQHFKEMK